MSGAASSDEKGDGEEPSAGETGDAPVPQAGVLGNLPKTRPSVRSPRRRERKQTPEAAAEEPVTPPDRRSPDHRPQERSRPEPEPVETPSAGNPAADLDALARGGIAIAGEAASLGLRIAGRAAAALRDAVERR